MLSDTGACHPARRRIVLVTVLSMLVQPVAPLFAGQTQASAQKPAAAAAAQKPAASAVQKPAAASAQPAPPDLGWPRAYQTPSGIRFTIHQPQIASWEGQRRMVAYAAVSVDFAGEKKPDLGTVKIEANTSVAVDDRLVSFSDLALTETNFPTLSKEQVRDLAATLAAGIPAEDRVIALDRVLASVDKSQITAKNVEGLSTEPPPIFFSQTPAVLVNVDGDPIWSPIKDNDLKFAVNTNWDLFLHEPSKTYYLLDQGAWLKTSDLKGTWEPAGKLPESFKKLPADENFKEVRAAVPGKKLSASKAPRVFVSFRPAELIVIQGEPRYLLVDGTNQLLWVSDAEADLFRMGKAGTVYYLIAGRWFSAPGFGGPWTFATPNLPADFQKIPLEHPRSRVLASVPGTQQAAEAVLLAQVPQTARVNRKEIKAPDVVYQGDPKFEPVKSTKVEYAVNTDKDIIKFGDLYYMCFQGVWFMSKKPDGPWEVCSKVPKEIYEIPASSPVHNVTYVTVVEDNDDEWVTFAAVAAYTGVMIAFGCAWWGTGYYHPPYWGWGPYYPYYYPRYPTYGYGAWYNPWTGGYGRAAVAYGPYGGAGVGARYNPATGTYARGAVAWGPYGARGAAEAYNPRTGTYGQTRQGSGVYGSWGSTAVQRGDDWARTSRVTNNLTGTTTRVTQGSGGGTAVTRNTPGPGGGGVARTGSGDVYAGRDGNVYRNDGSGWQQYDNGSWNTVEKPQGQAQAGATARDQAAARAGDRTGAGAGTTGAGATTRPATGGSIDRSTVDQLNRDRGARVEGTQRTSDWGSVRSSGAGSSRAGSYRPSGGGRAGGGGRRR